MGCHLKNFNCGEWETASIHGHAVAMAPATVIGAPAVSGVAYKLDGVFKGFVHDKAAVLYWVERDLGSSEYHAPQPRSTGRN